MPSCRHSAGRLWVLLLYFALCLGAMIPGRALAVAEGETVLHREDSLYQFLIVLENAGKNERYMANLEKTTLYQGGIDLAAPDRLLFEYTRISFVGLAFLDQTPKNALFVGLGIGAMPRFMAKHFPETSIEVAEIDPAVVKLAKEYFFFKEGDNLKVSVEDGRQFVKRRVKKGYDVIFLDAYQGDSIPFHLTTREFLQEVKSRLNEGGVVVANILSPTKNKFFTAMVKTYQAEFPSLVIFKGKSSGNHVFVAGNRLATLDAVTAKAKAMEESRQLGLDLAAISREQLLGQLPDDPAEILTDDFAPVNIYRHME